MNPLLQHNHRVFHVTVCLTLLATVAQGAELFNLSTGQIAAQFDGHGLVTLSLPKSRLSLGIVGCSALTSPTRTTNGWSA
jgi:hypothetical protein